MRRMPWWVVLGMVPFGVGAFASVVPGLQRRRPLWVAAGLLSIALFVAAAVVSETEAEDASGSGGLFIVSWIVSIVTVLALRKPFLDAEGRDGAWQRDLGEAQARLDERREALALAERDPWLAQEVGVGRPDVPGARHAGLVDVNHADAASIALLPGLDAALAERAVAIREDVDGFSSLADFGSVMDLDGNRVERLRERAVFLPR